MTYDRTRFYTINLPRGGGSYTAKDGRRFTGERAYERGSLYDKAIAAGRSSFKAFNDAPGGPRHLSEMKAHGAITKITLVPAQSRAILEHADGHRWTERHTDPARLYEIAKDYMGVPEYPNASHHQRARALPVGPGEHERLGREDGREPEAEPDAD